MKWDKEALKEKISLWKSKKESIVFTNGCFDLLHVGHIYLINKASEFGQHLIVAINSDLSIKKLKGENRPINNQHDRAFFLESIGVVDAVVIFNEDTPIKLLEIIKPDVLVKGGDYIIEEIVGKEYAKKVEIINFFYDYSTTDLIQKIKGV